MKTKLTLLLASGCLLANSAFAANMTAYNNLNSRTNQLEKEISALRTELFQLRQEKTVTKGKKTSTELYNYGSAVTTSPYVGLRPAFDASDLITMLPSMNEDLKILQQRQKLEDNLLAGGDTSPDRPILMLSGHVEGQGLWNSRYNNSDKTDVNLSSVELEALSEISPWATGMIVLSYDDTAMATGVRRTGNSNVYVNRAYLTIGRLSTFPVYATIGQAYVPFGAYSTNMVTTPMTSSLFKNKQRTAILGFAKNGLYGSGYVFHGDTYTGHTAIINQWGLNLGYGATFKQLTADLGVSYLSNIADADGFQTTASTGIFTGFGTGTGSEKLDHYVSAYNVHGNLSYGPVSLIAEFIDTIRSFAMADASYNGKGARVAALNTEAAYKFNITHFPANISAGYGQTWEALAFNLPEYSYYAKTGISLFNDTVESLEYRHDVNYRKTDTYSGNGSTADTSNNNNKRRSRNLVTFQVGIYF